MAILIGHLIFSGILLAAFNLAALSRGEGPGSRPFVVAALAALPSIFCLASPNCILQAVFLFIVAVWGFRRHQTSLRWYARSSCLAVLTSYGVFAAVGWVQLRQFDEERKIYPYESMTARLSYEKRPERGKAASQAASEQAFEARQEQMIQEGMNRGWLRNIYLRQLHEDMTDIFTASDGFGAARMLRVRPGAIANSPIQARQAVQIKPVSAKELSPGWQQEAAKKIQDPSLPAADDLHLLSIVDFIYPQAFGYIRNREHVAGFLSHQFKELPVLDEKAWRVTRIELISLLKFDEPRVYVSESLPRMQELIEAPTRPLDEFENGGLSELRAGARVKIKGDDERLRMVGALRATETCLKCHGVQRGEMLGAFSYRLARKP
jgi:hypothetical protein